MLIEKFYCSNERLYLGDFRSWNTDPQVQKATMIFYLPGMLRISIVRDGEKSETLYLAVATANDILTVLQANSPRSTSLLSS